MYLCSFFIAVKIAFLEISIPIPLESFNWLNKLITIQPVPVPISKIVIFFPSYTFNILSTNNSVSGLGISVPLLTLNFLLQNSFSSRIYATGSFLDLLCKYSL